MLQYIYVIKKSSKEDFKTICDNISFSQDASNIILTENGNIKQLTIIDTISGDVVYEWSDYNESNEC